MDNRKNKKRDLLNSMRLIFLDWDPMNLFSMGQAGLEEYDEFIPKIAKKIQKGASQTNIEHYLKELVRKEMDTEPNSEQIKIVAKKLSKLELF